MVNFESVEPTRGAFGGLELTWVVHGDALFPPLFPCPQLGAATNACLAPTDADYRCTAETYTVGGLRNL